MVGGIAIMKKALMKSKKTCSLGFLTNQDKIPVKTQHRTKEERNKILVGLLFFFKFDKTKNDEKAEAKKRVKKSNVVAPLVIT